MPLEYLLPGTLLRLTFQLHPVIYTVSTVHPSVVRRGFHIGAPRTGCARLATQQRLPDVYGDDL